MITILSIKRLIIEKPSTPIQRTLKIYPNAELFDVEYINSYGPFERVYYDPFIFTDKLDKWWRCVLYFDRKILTVCPITFNKNGQLFEKLNDLRQREQNTKQLITGTLIIVELINYDIRDYIITNYNEIV